MEGRHVGLDFYDLLIEAEGDAGAGCCATVEEKHSIKTTTAKPSRDAIAAPPVQSRIN